MDIYLPLFTDIINDSLKRGIFPDELKLAEVIPLFKKADPFDKTNYRPVSSLSHISKVSERIIYNQINKYIEPFLSKVIPGFRKNHNTKHSLLKMLETFNGFSAKSLSYIHSYLNKRLQKTNVNCDFSLWKEIFSGVPQGSILGLLLFNIHINDIFFLSMRYF